MAALSGYALTVVPTALLTITADVQSCTIAGLTLDFSEVKEVGDTNRIPNYAKLRTALKGQTSDTWTITDSGTNIHAGLGVVASVSALNYDTDGHATYTVTVQPTTSWTYTPNP